jgi:purine nucleosidase
VTPAAAAADPDTLAAVAAGPDTPAAVAADADTLAAVAAGPDTPAAMATDPDTTAAVAADPDTPAAQALRLDHRAHLGGTMSVPAFPTIDRAERRRRLALPSGQLRVVIDTDTANEIDDQFALAWAFASRDRLEIEGVYAEPYSFGIYRDDLIRTADLLSVGEPLPEELAPLAGWVNGLAAAGRHPSDVAFVPPDEGMERSYQEIKRVDGLMGAGLADRSFRGAPNYLTGYHEPVRSDAVDHLIERAMAPADQPLYVAAIGCVTNIASALLLEPRIVERIVVVWTSGYPTWSGMYNYSFNLEQDLLASQLLFTSGVPLVYLPGYYLGAQLRLSLPEIEAWIKGRGAIGDYLHHLYVNNPLHDQRGITERPGSSWVIWDLINFAWLLEPSWVPTRFVPAPRLGDDQRWHTDGAPGHEMREAYEINRNAIMIDVIAKLAAAAGAQR